MKNHYRLWKHLLAMPLFIAAFLLMRHSTESTAPWYIGMGLGLILATAYVAEEITWIVKRRGRPCGCCGMKVQMHSFRLHNSCPHCGQSAV